SPVATLAFLATTTTPRARPPAAFSRLSTTDGPEKRERVNTAADAVAGPSETTTKRSSPSSRRPADPACARNPSGNGTRVCGRSGLWLMGPFLPAPPSPGHPGSPAEKMFAELNVTHCIDKFVRIACPAYVKARPVPKGWFRPRPDDRVVSRP